MSSASLASSKTPGLATVYEVPSSDSNQQPKEPKMSSSSSSLQMPMLSRGRRPSAAVVEADFVAMRQQKVGFFLK